MYLQVGKEGDAEVKSD